MLMCRCALRARLPGPRTSSLGDRPELAARGPAAHRKRTSAPSIWPPIAEYALDSYQVKVLPLALISAILACFLRTPCSVPGGRRDRQAGADFPVPSASGNPVVQRR